MCNTRSSGGERDGPMRKTDLFTMKSMYRDAFRVRGYRFGSGDPAVCIVGALRGNEHQQLFAASQVVQTLGKLEQEGKLDPKKEILVIPCGNPYSMNIRKRFWTIDNTDINRMFPGYDRGETTQRIAAGIFNTAQKYQYGIQFFYMNGTFAPHIRMMATGFEDTALASQFGFPYVMVRNPRPFDTTTLNYNWQVWDTNAVSLYTTTTDTIDTDSAGMAVHAILRFLSYLGILQGNFGDPEPSRIIHDENLLNIRNDRAGIFQSFVKPGQKVKKGELMAVVSDAYEGTIRSRICAPDEGEVLFMHYSDMAYADTTVFKLVH